MHSFYTYLHCKPDGTPFYVGKGFGRRARVFHSGRNTHHKNIVAKHGRENIGVFIFPCESEEQAFSDEMQHIAQLRDEGFELVNQTNGGDGSAGFYPSEETRRKMSEVRKGKKHPDGTGQKIGNALKGKPKSETARENMRIASRIRWGKSEERKKSSIGSTGNKNCVGRKISDETRRRISEGNKLARLKKRSGKC